MKPLIQATDLKKIISSDDLVILDARAGNEAKNKYLTSHVEGAIHADLDKDLAEIPIDPAIGGRHPLPDIQEFARFLGNCGITPYSQVIIYDEMNGANSAARCWWMLKAIGHDKVQVLDGGIQKAMEADVPTSEGEGQVTPAEPYPVSDWKLPMVTMDQIERNIETLEFKVIDVRSSERYDGIHEPIDLIAGHIPGAVNVPLTENLTTDGTFKSPEELRKQYHDFDPGKTVVHCGSGVTACHTLLAFAHMHSQIPHLYVGSWSEWSRNDKPMILKK